MKTRLSKKLLSFFLVLVLALTTPAAVVAHAADGGKGKYISEVYVATGDDSSKAKQWLIDNGWEPIADMNEDKTSDAPGFDDSVAYLGIKRTNDPKDAITDMATMNQLGDGYSFEDYEKLVAQKKADIKEFIMTFVPALEEYRANYNGEGSEGGQKRAQYAHDLLNKFYDGKDDEYAVNDTGLPLGDLFLNKTRTEYKDAEWEALSEEEKAKTADLQQIILESTGMAVITIEQTLGLATDTDEESWLDRLDSFTGEDLVEKVKELTGEELAPSAARSKLAEDYEDYAKILAEQWTEMHENVLWFENYSIENGFADEDGQLVDDYDEAVDAYFDGLQESDAERYETEYQRYLEIGGYYFLLDSAAYSGEWGESLYDLFRPEEDDEDYSEETDYFLPIAAALSKGQRAALDLIPLTKLIELGMNSEDTLEAQFPSLEEIFKDTEKDSISVYSGMNRAIFRKGVAITSKARMQKNLGRDPYDSMWDENGIGDILFYTGVSLGFVTLLTGTVMAVKASKIIPALNAESASFIESIASFKEKVEHFYKLAEELVDIEHGAGTALADQAWAENGLESLCKKFGEAQDKISAATKTGYAGKIVMGIGGALMIAAAALKAAQLVKFYNRDFTQIPMMIVDEADIVTYYTDKNGKQQQSITFDQFAYYEVVKCNRQQVGIHKNAQNGVADYASWGCGDAADLNGDVGKEWLALYVNKSSAKGNPILADSLTRVYGDVKKPADSDGFLHMFCSSAPTLLDDMAYCYANDDEKGGMYLYWKSDENAYTASAFNYSYLALAAIGGLALGIVGTTGVILPKRKKENGAA